ncbi:hypothetical protein EAI_08579 [Harpegnathos saltator]|uniref:Uncharacterized protein n=2 Tax=Harpegnathos saltator TaxID=610380 RepID=E2C843_HARSA|nr:hypothetical protein EAI_08579 [Harpegnathos saltator]
MWVNCRGAFVDSTVKQPRRSFSFLERRKTMESWLSDVQRVRIPRPKFGSGNSVRRSNSSVQHVRSEMHSRQGQDVAKATEELRQALQDKL